MKGIYLTQEGKEEIEKSILELSLKSERAWAGDRHWYQGRINMLNDILNESIVLPVEESWNQFNMSNKSLTLENKKIWYPNGVIIKLKEL
jgi:hypothetical protein